MTKVCRRGIVVSGQNGHHPRPSRNTEKKLGLLRQFFENREVEIEVVLKVQRELHVADITIQVGGLLVRGEGKTDDMYASINVAVDRIERQIRKYKTRINRRMRKLDAQAAGVAVAGQAEDEDADGPRLVKTKRFDVKPMSVEEAIMQMELLGHDFYVFRNDSTGGVNVVYRRNDGDYGLIEPESR